MSYEWRDDIYYVMGALQSDHCIDLPNDTKDDLAYLAGETIVAENGTDYYADPISAATEEANEFYPGGSMTLWAIPMDSYLYEMLQKWHGGHSNMMGAVRGAFEQDNMFYFCTGCGYDVMSADLLGGTADGQAAREFDAWIS